ncbi:MAG: hypothetical protein Q7K26_06665 [bacterium]|nr:hypothetical protein [bacterium]
MPVLCIVGRCRTGKTWAVVDWVNARNNELENAAYMDCKGIGFGGDGVLHFNAVERDLSADHYPKLALDGIDIVVVDEPGCNPVLVEKLVDRAAPDHGKSAHRLIVLLIQNTDEIERFNLREKQFRSYSTAGLPLATRAADRRFP